MSRPILLVGSVPAQTTEQVLETAAGTLGSLAKRLPDGETGERAYWIAWQQRFFEGVEGLEHGQRIERNPGVYVQQFRIKDGWAEKLELGDLGYASAAIQSYKTFAALRAAGKIAAGTRFQVSLPTPIAVVWAFMEPAFIAGAWPAYERALGREIDRIVAAIPASELAFQWDIAVEPVFILGKPDVLKAFPESALAASIARASTHIPAEAELGLHLCFGDTSQKHSETAETLHDVVAFANEVAKAVAHPLAWVHFPAPPVADYDAFVAPLKDLSVAAETEVYVGLVNAADGLEGALARLKATQKVIRDFGVATECGMGRKSPERLVELLELQKAVANA